ncbi:MAG TPA: hypothetical protein VFT37_09480 [Telluria sp.]|nr:hypothetical protein [Telluria sp.]
MAGPLGGKGNIDGPVGRFQDPRTLAITPTGVLHVYDYGAVRTVTPLLGTDSQVATLAQPYNLSGGTVFDAAGNRFTANMTSITRTSPDGTTTTFAGNHETGNVDGAATVARLGSVRGLAIDAGGNIYANDIVNNAVRKITPAGMVSTFASLPGPATAIAVDAAGNVYAALGTAVHRFAPSGAGTVLLAADDSTPGHLAGIAAMAVGKDGNVYVAEDHGCSVRKITPAGVMTTFAGKSEEWGSTDGVGEQARFCQYFANGLHGLVADSAGNLYVSDTSNGTVRKITPGGEVSTIAGRAAVAGHVDGSGGAVRFGSQNGFQLSADAQGNVYVGESVRIRKVSANGQSSTLNLPATGATGKPVFYAPGQLASGGRAVAFSDGVLSRVDANGTFSFLAGQAGVLANADGTGAQATLRTVSRMTMDGQGNVFLVDSVPVQSGVMWFLKPVYRKVTEGGTVSTLVEPEQLAATHWIASHDGGQVVVSNNKKPYEVTRIAPDGSRTVLPVSETEHVWATAVAVDRQNNVYVAEFGLVGQKESSRIRKITPAGVNSIVAGQAGMRGVRPGALPASLGVVEALEVGADGMLYLISENSLLRIVP